MSKVSIATHPQPDRGAYWMDDLAAMTDQYPVNGRGTVSATPAAAIWANIFGLAAGEFEVVVTGVVQSAAAVSTFTEEHADGSTAFILGTVTGLAIPMRDGFTVSTSAGALIQFRIQVY